jgi:hypothetical protein
MPKINTKVYTKSQQQSLRRMKERTSAFETQFIDNNINCVSLDRLYCATADELTALLPIIKKIIQHNEKVAKLVSDNCFRHDEIKSDEYNPKLYDYLMIQYKGVKGQNLKYKNCHRKDEFRQSVLNENQLEFNNTMSIENENTIKKLFNDIDINSYEPCTREIEKTKKETAEKRAIHIEAVEKEIIIPDAPLVPDTIIKHCESITPVKKPKRVRRTKAEMLEAKKPEKEMSDTKKLEIVAQEIAKIEEEYEYDSDIEGDIKRLEEREQTDQDKNTEYDLNQWKTKINKLWKTEIEEGLSSVFDDEDDDTRINDLINMYIQRTKGQIRGRNEKLGYWANRNHTSLKKIIVAIVKSINNKINKDNEC